MSLTEYKNKNRERKKDGTDVSGGCLETDYLRKLRREESIKMASFFVLMNRIRVTGKVPLYQSNDCMNELKQK